MTSLGPTDEAQGRAQPAIPFLVAILAGAAVAVAARRVRPQHDPAGQALFTLGFSGTINMKAWLATIVLVLAIVQVLLALWMYGKLGRRRAGVGRAGAPARRHARVPRQPADRVPLPLVARLRDRHAEQPAASWHSLLGCAFYGAFTVKVLCVRSPAHAELGAAGRSAGCVFALLVGLWLTSALWFFHNSGFPSF